MKASTFPRAALLATLALTIGCSGLVPLTYTHRPLALSSVEQPFRRLAFLGEAIIEHALEIDSTSVGGLSAISYDRRSGTYFALPDDPSYFNPTRIYTLEIDLGDISLDTGDVTVDSVTLLRNRQGETLAKYAIDGEGLVRTESGTFFLSSEGNVERGVQPSIHEVSADGTLLRELPLPRRYLTGDEGTRGVRHNLALEALTLSPEGSRLIVGIENALVQDGAAADVDAPSPARILVFDLLGKQPIREYLYWVEPVPQAPPSPDGFRVNGLVELLALEGNQLLALERAFVAGVGNTVRLYLVDFAGATDIHTIDLDRARIPIRPVRKRLLLDLADLGLPLDNIEGMTHGPDLPDGRHTLLLVSDNNFSPRQKTQILAFAWSHRPATLPEIQGAAHVSPLDGTWLFGVEGTVTALAPAREGHQLWLQTAPTEIDAVGSLGLTAWSDAEGKLRSGDGVRIAGRVVERGRSGSLSVTGLETTSVVVVSRDVPLPEPRLLDGRIPAMIDDDSLSVFDPDDDAIDFFESLEGMRVELSRSTVVGASSRYGDLVVVPARGVDAVRTQAGGVLLTETSPNSQRVQIDPRLLSEADRERLASLPVGSEIAAPLVGVLDYAFGTYEVVLTEAPASAAPAEATPQRTPLEPSGSALTVASFNVENLDALDSAQKFGRVADVIARDLASPDIVALQEIQDDNGPEDDGVVTAAGTLDRLVREILAAGGPNYAWYQIDPENNADGGQPGSNIRVAFLVNPDRVEVPEREGGSATTTVSLDPSGDGVRLSTNPGRVAANHPAFAEDESRGYQAGRKPLALECEFDGQRLIVINVHFKSKGGDDGLFGATQPPHRKTEAQRIEQARLIRQFADDVAAADPLIGVVVLGDLNEHEFRPPVRELTATGLVNLVDRVPLASRYSYNFQGNSQILDHILVSHHLAAAARPEVDIVHVNADFPASDRASDHDPIVMRLDLESRRELARETD